MNRVKHARFMRSMESNGKVIAEVEFSMELSDQKFVAVLEHDGEPTYKLRNVFRNDSDLALDWYDNAEHKAYSDVTNAMFGHERLNKDRESFVLDVLDYEGVRADMEQGYK